MTTTKVYKTIIGARMAILMGRIKSFFTGSHYVAESYTLKYNKIGKLYHVTHYTMTHDEKRQFDEALVIKQQELVQMAEQVAAEIPTKEYVDNTAPKMNAKPKQKAKPKVKQMDTNIDTENILKDIKNRGAYNGETKPKTKKKYYHNNGKKKNTNPNQTN